MADVSWIEYEYVHETKLALCVRVVVNLRATTLWVPKKLVVGRDTRLLGVPAWFAKQRGLPAGRWDRL